MLFVVSRTSTGRSNPNCQEAMLKHIPFASSGAGFFDDIKTVWTIEINSMDELIAFCDKYGDIVIQPYWCNPDYKEIEIYDGYRE